jgi:hypothetical protein
MKHIQHKFELCHITESGEGLILRAAFTDSNKTHLWFGWLFNNSKSHGTVQIPVSYGCGHFTDKKIEKEMTKHYNNPDNVDNYRLATYLNGLLLSGLINS